MAGVRLSVTTQQRPQHVRAAALLVPPPTVMLGRAQPRGTVNGMGTPRHGVVADDPRMLALWDPAANPDADPTSIGKRSSRKRNWRCPAGDDHRWAAPPSSISRAVDIGYTGCPCCAGRRLSVTNSFAALFPAAVALWDTDANDGLTAHDVVAGSPNPVWWTCPEGPDHRWQCSPLVMRRTGSGDGPTGCPSCAGKRASVTNSVASHPQLSAEWHPTANGTLRPQDVVVGSQRKVWWRCLENDEHEWQAICSNRSRGRGCPHCRKSLRSMLEVGLAYELQLFFPDLDLDDDKVVIDGVVRHVDLLLRAPRIVIEVDGRYHHDGLVQLERDRGKTVLLTDAGYRVLRLREDPLPAVGAADALVPRDVTIKQAADAVLTRIAALGWVALPNLSDYLEEAEPRRVDLALAHVQAERPGRKVRLPGPRKYSRVQRWEQGLAMLRDFVAREGHANVPWEHVEGSVLLGKWVGAKRAQHRRGRMDPDRARVLSGLPGWLWDAVEEQWENGYQHLLTFLDREGHLDVPAYYWDDDGFPLGSWVRSHRRPGGGRRTITAEQQERLEAVPGWTYASTNDTFWGKAVAAFDAFARREGHCQTPRGHRENGINIDAWSKHVRTRYHRGTLSPDRAEELESVPGWSWRPQEDLWEDGFAALVAHASMTGSCAVPRTGVESGYSLAAWAREQRKRHAEGSLPATRRARLEGVPGWTWDPHEESWERHYAAIQQFVAREGHARVPTDHIEAGLPLASWVIRHRQDHKAGKVPAERAARLEQLPGWAWDVLEARWEEHFDALTQFCGREGHARVPSAHLEDGRKLGSWVIAQRQNFRVDTLSAQRTSRLSQMPGWTWDARDVAWEAGFNGLTAFHQRTGHCHVPTGWLEDGYRLGQWLGVQQRLLAAGGLREDRARRLTDLTGRRSLRPPADLTIEPD